MTEPTTRTNSTPPEPRPVGIAPPLETERLRLRPHRAEDFPACAAMWREPEVVRYTIGTASPPQRTWQRLLAYCGHWLLMGYGYWAVECKATGRYLGELGFADFRRDEPSLAGFPEIGWALAAHARGRGYATEALRQVIEWGDTHLTAARTVCLIARENVPSARLAEKLGYSIVVRAPTDAQPHMLLARDAPR